MVEGAIGAAGAATITLEGAELACRATTVVVSSQMGGILRSQRGLTIWITSSAWRRAISLMVKER